ncbi:unnamed protein product [Eretmochelys imbricata]
MNLPPSSRRDGRARSPLSPSALTTLVLRFSPAPRPAAPCQTPATPHPTSTRKGKRKLQTSPACYPERPLPPPHRAHSSRYPQSQPWGTGRGAGPLGSLHSRAGPGQATFHPKAPPKAAAQPGPAAGPSTGTWPPAPGRAVSEQERPQGVAALTGLPCDPQAKAHREHTPAALRGPCLTHTPGGCSREPGLGQPRVAVTKASGEAGSCPVPAAGASQTRCPLPWPRSVHRPLPSRNSVVTWAVSILCIGPCTLGWKPHVLLSQGEKLPGTDEISRLGGRVLGGGVGHLPGRGYQPEVPAEPRDSPPRGGVKHQLGGHQHPTRLWSSREPAETGAVLITEPLYRAGMSEGLQVGSEGHRQSGVWGSPGLGCQRGCRSGVRGTGRAGLGGARGSVVRGAAGRE